MRFRSPADRPRVAPIDLTSMVDMVFLLIIFFLTTSSFIEKTKADVELPREKGESVQEVARGAVIVNISRNGTYIVSGEYLSLDGIASRVQREAAAGRAVTDLDIVVRADRLAPLTHLNALARRLSDLGVVRWRLSTVVPPEGDAP
ncbi:MAG TPA: hypothetical protein DEB06_01600 [Phycisphaerales bacterium]|nr:hypothetical protein [Phycisphaerales bacterium]